MYIDTITRIKNAQNADKEYVKVPYSKMDKAVVELMEKNSFIKSHEVKGKKANKIIKIYLDPEKPIKGVDFLSKPSIRKYSGYRDLKAVKGGYGMLVVSTPNGVITGDKAKKEKVGGQLLFKMW